SKLSISLPMALLIAASTRSLGIFTFLAFWKQRRRAALVFWSGPPDFTARAISFPIRVNCFAILSHLANMVALRTSKIRPITFKKLVWIANLHKLFLHHCSDGVYDFFHIGFTEIIPITGICRPVCFGRK